MNKILITSISSKVPLISSIRDSANLKEIYIIGADINKHVVGSHFVDEFWHMPKLADMPVNEILNFCKKKGVNIIFPTRDGELKYFAEHYQEFKQNNISVMVSDKRSIEITQDKFLFFKELRKMGYPVIETTRDINALKCSRFVVKERYGSGAKNMLININKEDAISGANYLESPIYQPFIQGKEYSVDVYVNRNGKSKGAIARERVMVVDGESQITRTIENEKLTNLSMNLAEDLGLSGHVMFQILLDTHNNPQIIECNPRIGGASTLSVRAGLTSFQWFILESNNESLDDYPFIQCSKDLTLIRYKKDLIM